MKVTHAKSERRKEKSFKVTNPFETFEIFQNYEWDDLTVLKDFFMISLTHTQTRRHISITLF